MHENLYNRIICIETFKRDGFFLIQNSAELHISNTIIKFLRTELYSTYIELSTVQKCIKIHVMTFKICSNQSKKFTTKTGMLGGFLHYL